MYVLIEELAPSYCQYDLVDVMMAEWPKLVA
jgi:hypothetical protein